MSESSPLISVVVPVIDEEQIIGGLLDHLDRLRGRWEVIIVDGGSTDATVEIAQAHRSAPRLVIAPGGRALQCNAGARAASGDVLAFLHADTALPPHAHRSVAQAIGDPRVIGGNFSLRFDGGDRFSRVLGAWYAVQRRAGVYYGDSVIWLRRSMFDRLGGFRALAIMEDYEFVRRLERAGRTVCLPGPALTSARRWQRQGLIRTIASWVTIRWLYLAGVSPERLARLYRPAR